MRSLDDARRRGRQCREAVDARSEATLYERLEGYIEDVHEFFLEAVGPGDIGTDKAILDNPNLYYDETLEATPADLLLQLAHELGHLEQHPRVKDKQTDAARRHRSGRVVPLTSAPYVAGQETVAVARYSTRSLAARRGPGRRSTRPRQTTVEVVDYGAGSDRPPQRAVADIYRRAATGPAWGRFLFGLARGLRPRCVLELGTNLGVGAAHLAGALALNQEGGPAGRLVTLEGAPELAALARAGLDELGHGARVEVVVGPFAETLPGVLEDGPFDLVFVDGHHQAEAALGYLDVLEPALADGAVVVLDDVEPGRSVRRAWKALRASGRASTGVYVVKYGIFVHRPADARGATTAAARVSPPDPTRA